jgi:subtilisin family serine protease
MFPTRMTAAALLALTLSACADQPSAPSSPDAQPDPMALQQQREEVVPGEILVKMKDGVSLDVLTGTTTGLRLDRRLAAPSRVAVLSVSRGREREEAARLSADPRVEYAEPNYIRRISQLPLLWAYDNPGGLTAYFNTSPYSALPAAYSSLIDADIDIVPGIGAGGSPVVVGSLDTGVDTDHPEFTGKLLLGWDWVNNDALPEDDNGHGTATVGIMIGTTVGISGRTGAGTNVKAHVQKVCNATGGCPTSAIVNGIYAAANYPGMVAMNLSISGASISMAEVNAISYAVNTRGVLVVAAAGNNGSNTVGCPACNVNTIAVGAVNWRGAKSYYTQYGSGIDLVAPGGEIYSNTTPEMGIYSAWLNGGYAYLQGTSMAAPMVTGTAGVVSSVRGFTGATLRTQLESTADDLGAPGYDGVFGWGRLNVYRAVTQ